MLDCCGGALTLAGMNDTARTALVTGAAKRIGRAIALDLAAQGWAVAVHHNRSADEAAAVVREIEAGGGRAVALRADLTREDEVRTLVPAAAERLGPLGLLVNNASPFVEDDIAGAEREIWDLHLETNLRAPVVLIRDFARQLPEGRHGNVVNMLDQRVLNLTPHFLSYTLSKSGLWTLTRTLALALAPRIRVNGIGPGPAMRSERQTEEQFRAQWEAVPLARATRPAEICAAIRFILEAPSLTGQILALDGGEHLGWAQASRGIVPEE
ncbi:MAG TPA: SDR family oxidoreductase [Alphaproteobacteria bacterium]|nr:SDR family oxidoreductase [Alphaproteobacteria bacterium]